MGLSEDVSYITLCKPLPLVLHGYVWPFALVYVSLVSVWIGGVYGLDESPEVFYLCLAAVAAVNIITCLFCVWSMHVRCALTCKQARADTTINNFIKCLISVLKYDLHCLYCLPSPGTHTHTHTHTTHPHHTTYTHHPTHHTHPHYRSGTLQRRL